jgi:hypothetical protein
MPWAAAGAAVAGVASAAGGILGSNAASSAAKAQQQSQQNTLNWIQQVYGNTQNNLSPFVNTGQQAQSQLAGFYGLPGGNASGATQGFSQYMNTPFYQFPLQQANLATNRSLAASGLTNSGAQLRDVSQLNAGYASQGLSQYLSGLGSLASGGQSAAAQLGSIGVGTGAQIAGANTAYGNAGAAGIIGSTNAINTGIGSTVGSLTNPNALNGFQTAYNNLGGSSYGPPNGSAPGSIPGGGTGSVPGGEGGGSLYGNET